MANKPLIRPYFFGGVALGGAARIPLNMDSVFQFFSFSVFQFPELFRNISGETEKLNFPGTFRQRFSIWIQFFSFSVFQFWFGNYLKN